MQSSTYEINRSIGRPIEFKGILAKHLSYLALRLVGLLLGFILCYFIGIPLLICIPFFLAGAASLILLARKQSKQHGEFGLMKKSAQRQIPDLIKINSRDIFKPHPPKTNESSK